MGIYGLFTPKHRRIADQGTRFREAGQYAQAIAAYDEAASMGSCYALYYLYKIYTSAPEPYRDDVKANEILERMCTAKIPVRNDPWLQNQMTLWAKTTLGTRLYKGIDGERDYKRAFELLSSIDPEAEFDEKHQVRNILGCMYFSGRYVQKDEAKAYHYLSLSGDPDGEAEYVLGYLYAQGRGGARKDKRMALTLLTRASKTYPPARSLLCSVAKAYLIDEPETAEKYLAIAASYGEPNACKELIKLYFTHTATYTRYETEVNEDVLDHIEDGMSMAEARNIVEQHSERHVTGVKHENLGKQAKRYLEILVKQAEGILRAEDEYDQRELEQGSRRALKRLMENYASDCRLYGEELYPRIEKLVE